MTGPAVSGARGPRWWAWGLALVPFLVVVLAQWRSAPPGDVTDGYQYLLHARALVEGRGYTDTGYIYSDLIPWAGPPARPPGLPLTLFAVYRIFGPVIPLMQAVILLFSLGFLVLAGRYFARRDTPEVGLAVTVLSGLVPIFPWLSTQLLNDLPFCFLFWLAVLVVDRDGPFDLRRSGLAILVVGAALAFREAGVALVAALGLFGLVNLRAHRGVSLIPAVVLGVVGLGAMLGTGVGVPNWVLTIEWNPASLLAKLGSQVMDYRLGLVGAMLYPWPSDLANDVYHVVMAPVMLLGLAAWVRDSWRTFGFCAAAGYSAMLMVLPATQARYLWPLEPFVIYGMFRGLVILVEAGRRFRPMSPRPVLRVAAAVLAVGATVGLLRLPPPPPLTDDPDTMQVVEWVRPLADEGARVAFFKPRFLAWETRVPAMALPLVANSASSDAVVEEFRRHGITHVIVQRGELRFFDAISVTRAIADHPARFEEIRRNDTYLAYRFRPEG